MLEADLARMGERHAKEALKSTRRRYGVFLNAVYVTAFDSESTQDLRMDRQFPLAR